MCILGKLCYGGESETNPKLWIRLKMKPKFLHWLENKNVDYSYFKDTDILHHSCYMTLQRQGIWSKVTVN